LHIKVKKECIEIINMILQTIVIVLRFIRETATKMIDYYNTMILGQKSYQTAVIKRPGRISMNHDNNVTMALINKVNPVVASGKKIRLKGIVRIHDIL